jgi:hypothetical protein
VKIEVNKIMNPVHLSFHQSNHEDIPEINNPKIRFPVLEGDKLMKEVLNGGYNVHPVPPPNSEIKERIRKRYERERIKIEKLLTLGYTTSISGENERK